MLASTVIYNLVLPKANLGCLTNLHHTGKSVERRNPLILDLFVAELAGLFKAVDSRFLQKGLPQCFGPGIILFHLYVSVGDAS